jgi:hypothetical protein
MGSVTANTLFNILVRMLPASSALVFISMAPHEQKRVVLKLKPDSSRTGNPNRCAAAPYCAVKFSNRTVLSIVESNICRNKTFSVAVK